jgi:hypothetical protein
MEKECRNRPVENNMHRIIFRTKTEGNKTVEAVP